MDMRGRLAIVGVGMTLGAHLTPRARSCIERADTVFTSVSDPIVERWLQEMHPDVRSLQPLYKEGVSRRRTYRAMVDLMLDAVRSGRSVCGAFYGHPGILALAPHEAVRAARAEGYAAYMEPGISSTDCLYADMGIDPGTYGCQYYEATQLLLYGPPINAFATLVVWQAAIAGDRTMARFSTPREFRQLLVEELLRTYPPQHLIALYEAATLPTQSASVKWVQLTDLADADIELGTTLMVPPVAAPSLREEISKRLAAMEAALAAVSGRGAPEDNDSTMG